MDNRNVEIKIEATPLISVIMPVYNCAKYLVSSIRSILDQTYTNIELICIDDGSIDASSQILKAQCVDNRLKVISQKNQGPSAARNAGLDCATGDYISFVDSDDYLDPNAYERLISVLAESQADIVVFGGNTFPESVQAPQWVIDKLNTSDKEYVGERAGEKALLHENSAKPFIWMHLIKRTLLETAPIIRFDTNLDIGEDQIAIFSYFPRANKVVFISDKLYNYRLNNSGSIMSNYYSLRSTKYEKHILLVKKILTDWKSSGRIDISGDLITYIISFLYNDFNEFPEYKKVYFAKKIMSMLKEVGWNLLLCREEAYDYAQTFIDYAMKDDIDFHNEIDGYYEELDLLKEQINLTLSSKTYRIGKLLTKKSKRMDDKQLLLENKKRIF